MRCPNCGSEKIHTSTTKLEKDGFSGLLACLGFLIFGGPLGILCGFCGDSDKYVNTERVCQDCGRRF